MIKIKEEREDQTENNDRNSYPNQELAAANLIGPWTRHEGEDCKEYNANNLHKYELGVWNTEASLFCSGGTHAQNPCGSQIEEHIGSEHSEGTEHNFLKLEAESIDQRSLNNLILLNSLLKGFRFVQLYAHPHTYNNHKSGENEWNTPTPGEERFWLQHRACWVRQSEVDDKEQAVRDNEADRSAQLWESTVERALICWSVFCCDKRRTRPFATEREALGKAQGKQEERSPQTDLSICWQEADKECCNTHG